jgi:hypothetical protein
MLELIERDPRNLVHEIEHLIDEHIGGSGASTSQPQHRDAVLAGNAVEVRKVGDQKLPQTDQLADQISAAHFSPQRQSAKPLLVQRLSKRDTGGGDKRADTTLEGRCDIGFGCGGRRGGDGGGGGVHSDLVKTAERQRKHADESNPGQGRKRGPTNQLINSNLRLSDLALLLNCAG